MVSRGSLEDRLKDIERELEALKIFRITPQLNKFKRNLMGERSFIKNQLSKLQSTKEQKQIEKEEIILTANRNRSEKMKRTWRYLKAIQKNYPVKLSLRELRTALRKHRQGLVTDVPDVAWRNPSP
ncbi:MAG: hypothetical protein AUH25_01665 [Thaumarchaeota archaeon 13_1_40CM_38_12]|nr:MAG: hypothetical protein AUH25_01665 [Thaumarchaeota archaeon 13_1_40CM_38_12]OLC33614.1 MAG: hypothetical protein AUH84_06820 [Thaumarchaeota archaeon 13_1_40CM_4_38_7]OLC92662.1 MAG: hypothetical protein AUI92_04670 [Thaumarchaeota archaeon 13_1_40CM_3_38_6]